MIQARLIAQKKDNSVRFSMDRSILCLIDIKPGDILEIDIKRKIDKEKIKEELNK